MIATRRRALLPLATLVAAVTLSGCGAIADAVLGENPPPAQRSEPGGEVTASADADVFTLQVGDCLNYMQDEGSSEISSLPTVPCSEPHDAEIYAETTVTEEQFATVDDVADQYCYDQFAGYVGAAYEDSALYYSTLVPTPDGFAAGDDVVQCVVVQETGGLTATVQGTGL
ncbi:septum formation family protein [Cellulomonas sp. 179-A 9B4 NHS]|uniref:septum formation family protein n=1 Tax=Cellulomonas sp. 179-A 9B4 NHS TaxID=3142379 RepID=UPI0039A02A0E